MKNLPYYEPTVGDIILSYMLMGTYFPRQKMILYGIVQRKRKELLKKSTFNQSIYRLEKGGYIAKKGDTYHIADRTKAMSRIVALPIVEGLNGKENTVIFFDIKEKDRKIRWWIRSQLMFWDYKMLQKSVWIGKGVPPKEWKERLKLLGVEDRVKMLTVVDKGK